MTTTFEPVYIVDIIGEVVSAMNASTDLSNIPLLVNYQYGRQVQVLQKLQQLQNSSTYQDTIFPLLVLYQDFPEKRGTGYYAEVTIPRICIAMLTTFTDETPIRYGKTFKPVLYPVYYAFLKYLAQHKLVVGMDKNAIPHTKWDRPGTPPRGADVNEFVDMIDISNLQIIINQFKTC